MGARLMTGRQAGRTVLDEDEQENLALAAGDELCYRKIAVRVGSRS